MKVLNIGSLNVDYVYSVDHILKPGETISSDKIEVFAGGKGLNQSVAIKKAGGDVYHGGIIGDDGQLLLDVCNNLEIKTDYLVKQEGKSGHTIIQVDKNAQNSILLYGGTNQNFTKDIVDNILVDFEEKDILLLQNEVNMLPYIIDKAYEKGMCIVLNPSPFNDKLYECDLSKISIFLLNEIEGEQLTGYKNPDDIIKEMKSLYKDAKIVLTLGENGVIYADKNSLFKQDIYKVRAVDTTAAGDTFTGYFIVGLIENMAIPDILDMCAKASAIAVGRHGATSSIPYRYEVLNF